jgi:hypothetical protein
MQQIQLNIEDRYLQALTAEEIKAYLQKELDFMLLERFGETLKTALSESNISLEEISKEAKQKAWERQKDKYLKGLKID